MHACAELLLWARSLFTLLLLLLLLQLLLRLPPLARLDSSANPGKRSAGGTRKKKFGDGARAAKMIKMYNFTREFRSDQ